jgi:hypothetical protein
MNPRGTSFSIKSRGKSNSIGVSVDQGARRQTLEGHDDW